MRITKQTPTTLALQTDNTSSDNVPFSLFFRFGVLPLIVALTLILNAKLTTLTCRRVEPTQVACNLMSVSLLGKQTTSIPTGQLQRADVQVSTDDDGDDVYRIILVTKTKSIIPLTEVYTSGESDKRQDADRINRFVNDQSQMSLTIQQDDRLGTAIFGGILVLFGGGFTYSLMTSKSLKTCVFDKASGHLYVTFKSMIRSETKQFQLQDIQSAQVIEGTDSDGDKIFRTRLNLRSGNSIELPIHGGDSEKHHAIAQAINTFLN